jgi:hypothetical protein
MDTSLAFLAAIVLAALLAGLALNWFCRCRWQPFRWYPRDRPERHRLAVVPDVTAFRLFHGTAPNYAHRAPRRCSKAPCQIAQSVCDARCDIGLACLRHRSRLRRPVGAFAFKPRSSAKAHPPNSGEAWRDYAENAALAVFHPDG